MNQRDTALLAIPFVSETKSQFKIDFFETNAPKGIAKDVTNLGGWRNGYAEVACFDPHLVVAYSPC